MAESANQPKTHPKGLMIWMIISQLMMLGSLVIWLLFAGMSLMAFDSGVSTEAWTFVVIVWSYPILPISFIIAAWISYAKQKNVLAVVLSGLSFAPPILCFLLIVIADFAWFAWFNQNGGLVPFRN